MTAADILPRRICIDKYVPAEHAIRNAILEVEKVGADPLLTDAVTLLAKAKEKVADYIDARITDEEIAALVANYNSTKT